MANRYCPQCGKEVLENSNFCFYCGANLDSFNVNPNPNPAPNPAPVPAPSFEGEYAEPVVQLKRRSVAPQIVSAALTYFFIIPMLFFPYYIPYGTFDVDFYFFWLYFSIVLASVLALVIEPLSCMFGIIRTVKFNRLGGKMISYVPSRNTFIIPTREGDREIYARDIASFNGPMVVIVTYYQDGMPVRFLSGWCVRDDIYILNNKLAEVMQTSVI